MTLEQEKQNLENRLKEIDIELENRPKIGDVCWFWNKDKDDKKVIGILEYRDKLNVYKYQAKINCFLNCEKITDQYVIDFVKGVKKYTIEDLRNGICAIRNDSTTEEIQELIHKIFPEAMKCNGGGKFYLRSDVNINKWEAVSSTTLPTQSVKDFL